MRGPNKINNKRTRVCIDFESTDAAFDWLDEQKWLGTVTGQDDIGFVLMDALHEQDAASRNEWLLRRCDGTHGNGREIERVKEENA
jgi:hypothetical protein